MGDKETQKFKYLPRKVHVSFICGTLCKFLNIELGLMFIPFSFERRREILMKPM